MAALTISDAAKACGVNRSTLQRAIQAGRLALTPDHHLTPEALVQAGYLPGRVPEGDAADTPQERATRLPQGHAAAAPPSLPQELPQASALLALLEGLTAALVGRDAGPSFNRSALA